MAKKVILFLFFSTQALAYQLRSPEISVYFPEPWTCASESDLWVCQESTGGRQKAAIVLVQARKALSKETYDYIKQQLQTPRSIKGKKGPILSRLISKNEKVLNGDTWFEALHHEGELDSYYTMYMSARRGDYIFLITMSAHKPKWDTYKPIFEKISANIKLNVSNVATQIASTGPQGSGPAPINNTQNISAHKTSKLHQPLNLPVPGLTPFRLILFIGVCAFAYLGMYAMRK